jgi:hypothetical protein
VFPAPRALVDQIVKVRVELRGTTGEIDGVRANSVERTEAGIDGIPAHDLAPTVGAGVNVTVSAGHVTQLAEVDL